jgi:hypothetical protein
MTADDRQPAFSLTALGQLGESLQSQAASLVAQSDRDKPYQICLAALSKAEALMEEVREKVAGMSWNGKRLEDHSPRDKADLERLLRQTTAALLAARRACDGLLPKSDRDKLADMQGELEAIRDALHGRGAGIDLSGIGATVENGAKLLGGAAALLLQLFVGGPDRQPI